MKCTDDSCPISIGFIIGIAISLNLFLLALRLCYRKEPNPKITLLNFIIWYQIQFWFFIMFFSSFYGLFMLLLRSSSTIKYYWNGLFGHRITYYILEWLGLVTLDLILWKLWCIFVVVSIILCYLILVTICLLGMFLLGIYLLGYANINP